MYNLGVVALRRGDFTGAETMARAALAIDPRSAGGHQLLGNVAVRRHDFAAAARHFGRAVELDSTSVQARVDWGAASGDPHRFAVNREAKSTTFAMPVTLAAKHRKWSKQETQIQRCTDSLMSLGN